MVFVVFLMTVACNNEKGHEVPDTSQDQVAADPGKAAQDPGTQKKTEELQKLSPYTLDQMNSLLPQELMGAKGSNISASSVSGVPYAEGTYPINDSSEVKVSIYDCAGDAGVGIYNIQYSNLMNFEMVSEEEYTKTIDFNGSRAIEHSKKDNSFASLTYLGAGRLLVTLEGKNTGVGMLKKAAGSLNFK
jgi:hypothetical protein